LRATPRARPLSPLKVLRLRFTNEDVFRNLDGVLETVRAKVTDLRPRIEDSAR
jgi:very-short-patch-repair endonuclease